VDRYQIIWLNYRSTSAVAWFWMIINTHGLIRSDQIIIKYKFICRIHIQSNKNVKQYKIKVSEILSVAKLTKRWYSAVSYLTIDLKSQWYVRSHNTVAWFNLFLIYFIIKVFKNKWKKTIRQYKWHKFMIFLWYNAG